MTLLQTEDSVANSHIIYCKQYEIEMISSRLKIMQYVNEKISRETSRQRSVINLIPSENVAPHFVRKAAGSVLCNKYSEGKVDARFYPGNKIIDGVEEDAIEFSKQAFGVPHANVQGYAGSIVNLAVYAALLSKIITNLWD